MQRIGEAYHFSASDLMRFAGCLARLHDRQPLDPRDEGGLAAVATMIEKEITNEIVYVEERFFETHCDEHGPDGEMREVPICSDRGSELENLQGTFRRFLEMRHAVLDRLAAHRALMAMMSG